MSRYHRYHTADGSRSYGDEARNDIGHSLEELESIDGSFDERLSRDERQRTNHIPLRSFYGRPSRESKHRPRKSQSSIDHIDYDLSRSDVTQRESAGRYSVAEDGEPLLPSIQTGEPRPELNGRSGTRAPTPWRELFRQLKNRVLSQRAPAGGSETGAPRIIGIGDRQRSRYPSNASSNAKYSPWSFLFLTLYNEFKFFFNMYFLLVALSQIIPFLRIGYLSTYVVPLLAVLTITLGKEAYDDIQRRKRDADANKEQYVRLVIPSQSKGGNGDEIHVRCAFPARKGRILKARGKSRWDIAGVEEERLYNEASQASYNSDIEEVQVQSQDLKVGDILKLGKDQRVPADLVILKSYAADSSVRSPSVEARNDKSIEAGEPLMEVVEEPPIACATDKTIAERVSGSAPARTPSLDGGGIGETFIRTDQLDGETDWKLRLASPISQSLDLHDLGRLTIYAGAPDRRVNEFAGKIVEARTYQEFAKLDDTADPQEDVVTSPLTIDNTAWANTVLASNVTVIGVVIYTGPETRQALSTTASRSKAGLLEYEINNLAKILCALTLTLSVVLVAVRGIEGRPGERWYVAATKFLILFSTIVPISLRVNLDMGKIVYQWFMHRDLDIPGTVVRTGTIPEELGRIEYLLSDKTGTLTQNEMDLRKIHVGTVSYANEAMDEVRTYVRQGFAIGSSLDATQPASLLTPSSIYQSASNGSTTTRTRREIGSRVRDLVLALALCHSVTPSSEDISGETVTTYQASSPDEIAIVRWAEQVGLRLLHRDRHKITLQSIDSGRVAVRVKILELFPFTSTGKRMGIILQFFAGEASSSGSADRPEDIWFYQKGADTVMTPIVAANDWLEEETGNMAREGLRTLVVGRRRLSAQQYQDFASSYRQASISLHDRDNRMFEVVKTHLEHSIELLGVTGVEDKLQKNVKPSLELLRNAGIKIWMLTGDKVETARCVAVSAKLVSRTQYIHTITNLSTALEPSAALDALTFLRSKPESTALLIDGDSLSHFLQYHRLAFISTAVDLPAVIACRCSPTQKANVATLIRQHTKKRVACIGDGGNDVSMIQAADVGVGIVGKEGRQASLAADFSITQFHHLTKLLVWHGRNSYKRSAKLAQFIIHRGLIISVCQTFYSIATQVQPHALYRDWLLVGYATVYTMAPVFSLVLDKDVDERLANLYPELYKELTTGRSLSYTTFFVWVAVSIYQGGIIQGCSQLLVDSDSKRMVSVSFTVLIVNELIMVAFEVVTWHWIVLASIVGTAAIYAGSVPFLGGYFDLEYVWTWAFAWRVVAISALSLIPPYCIKILRRTLKPPSYRKVQGI